jgi:hypothetical protein
MLRVFYFIFYKMETKLLTICLVNVALFVIIIAVIIKICFMVRDQGFAVKCLIANVEKFAPLQRQYLQSRPCDNQLLSAEQIAEYRKGRKEAPRYLPNQRASPGSYMLSAESRDLYHKPQPVQEVDPATELQSQLNGVEFEVHNVAPNSTDISGTGDKDHQGGRGDRSDVIASELEPHLKPANTVGTGKSEGGGSISQTIAKEGWRRMRR